MIDSSYVLIYQIILDFIAVGFLFWVYSKIPESRAKLYFSLITVAFLLYNNLMCIYYYPLQDYSLAEPISQGIFASSIAYVTFVVHLLFLIIEPSVTKSFHYRIFLLSQSFFFFMSFSPWFQEGLHYDSGLFKPIQGPLYKAFIASYFFWWTYVFAMAGFYYTKLKNKYLRQQAMLSLVSVFSMLSLTFVTNGILPAIYGSSQLSLLGTFWYLLFLIGIGLIIFKTDTKTLKKLQSELNILYKRLSPENQEALITSLGYLIFAFHEANHSFKKRVSLSLKKEKANIYIGRIFEKDEEMLDLSKAIPIRWLEGLIASLTQLEKDNFGLALALQKVLHERPNILNGDISKYLPASMRDDINAYAVQNFFASSIEQETELSPLEIAEKKVISHYLAKNNYNKTQTRKELQITVNTLNAKIRKYKIG